MTPEQLEWFDWMKQWTAYQYDVETGETVNPTIPPPPPDDD